MAHGDGTMGTCAQIQSATALIAAIGHVVTTESTTDHTTATASTTTIGLYRPSLVRRHLLLQVVWMVRQLVVHGWCLLQVWVARESVGDVLWRQGQGHGMLLQRWL